jgi:hypothetical protein
LGLRSVEWLRTPDSGEELKDGTGEIKHGAPPCGNEAESSARKACGAQICLQSATQNAVQAEHWIQWTDIHLSRGL